MKAPTIPMRRSPTIPNPVPCMICPASHPAMIPTITVKSEEQLDMQTLHRARDRLVGERTALINELRGILLERGIAARQGFTQVYCGRGRRAGQFIWSALHQKRDLTAAVRMCEKKLMKRTETPPTSG